MIGRILLALSLIASPALAQFSPPVPAVGYTGTLTPNDCANWNTATGTLGDAGAACGSGSGTVTTTGSPATGNLATFSGGTSITGTTSLGSGVLAALSTALNGTGAISATTSPTFVTPALGVATATTVNKVTLTAPATGSTLTIADGKTLTASNSLTFTGGDGTSIAFNAAGGTVPSISQPQSWTAAQTFANNQVKFTTGGGLTFNALAVGSGSPVVTCALGGAGTCAVTATAGSISQKLTLASASVSTTTLTITFPNPVASMYICDGYDFTTPAQRFLQTGGSTTTAVMTFYIASGATGYASGGASDVLYVKCLAN